MKTIIAFGSVAALLTVACSGNQGAPSSGASDATSSGSEGSGGGSAGSAGAGAGHPDDTYLPWFGGPSYYEKWSHGLPSDPSTFPISVWLQSPPNASRYA